ncbi:MAG: response regulator [Deltaproteobacteria bacterium]|nr:response regulator [Deltaproteobacteria bacterium]
MVVEAHPRVSDEPLIFVVDDDVVMGRMLSRALAQLMDGVRVRAFADPLRVFQAVVDHRPCVLLTDQEMPRCTGVELASALRDRLGPDCPRIVLVSGARVSAAEKSLFDAYFQKPFRIAHVEAAIRRWLRTSHSGIRAVDVGASSTVHTAPTQPPPSAATSRTDRPSDVPTEPPPSPSE